jgi:hypothetical protein
MPTSITSHPILRDRQTGARLADGASLLVQAHAAGRTDDATRWLEDAVEMNPQLYPTLADMRARTPVGRRLRCL